jgi:hypothetical protein
LASLLPPTLACFLIPRWQNCAERWGNALQFRVQHSWITALCLSHDSSVGTMMTERGGRSRLRILAGWVMFPFCKRSRPVLGPICPPIEWVSEGGAWSWPLTCILCRF